MTDTTERCITCGGEIDGDGVFSQSDVKSDGVERLADGETVGLSELMEMEDGPYYSLDCSMETAADRSGGDA